MRPRALEYLNSAPPQEKAPPSFILLGQSVALGGIVNLRGQTGKPGLAQTSEIVSPLLTVAIGRIQLAGDTVDKQGEFLFGRRTFDKKRGNSRM